MTQKGESTGIVLPALHPGNTC